MSVIAPSNMVTAVADDREQLVALIKSKAPNSSFFSSLQCQLIAKGNLSAAQWNCVRKELNKSAPEQAAIDSRKLIAFFDDAAKHLKWPSVRLNNGVKLRRTGEMSKNPGAINVFVESEWVGRITRDGNVRLLLRADEASTLAEIKTFAIDPAQVAAAYGQRYGHCCFCGLELTDHRSVDVGYGPICAEHFGLPWG